MTVSGPHAVDWQHPRHQGTVCLLISPIDQTVVSEMVESDANVVDGGQARARGVSEA